ncbi:hypothetical protein EDD37DRAFT_434516 [Exophiala viscosa]|uniref:uncharacterized protein n=1 Tax=Exophiala viscosa TaxID=2486360 RepID=UPI002198DCCF|nr:hypothetical protein EDD37DRAFT_434516 [Exophiala viscosa]
MGKENKGICDFCLRPFFARSVSSKSASLFPAFPCPHNSKITTMDTKDQKSAGVPAPETEALCGSIERQTASPSPNTSDAASSPSSPSSIARSALDLMESQATARSTAPLPPASSITNTNGPEAQDGNSSSPPSHQPPQTVPSTSSTSSERCERCILQRKKCDGVKPACGNCASSKTLRNSCVYPPGRPSRRQLAEMKKNNQAGHNGASGHQDPNSGNNNGGTNSSASPNNTTPLAPPQPPQVHQRPAARQPTGSALVTPQQPPSQMPTIRPSVLHAPGPQLQNQRSICSEPPPRWQPIDGSAQAGGQSRSSARRPITTTQAPSPFTAYGSIGRGQDVYLRPRLFGDNDGPASSAIARQQSNGHAPAFETTGGQIQTGQYPTRFPDLNWGAHHIYLADGSLNPSPPHGASTTPTVLGRTTPLVAGSLARTLERRPAQPPREEENAGNERQEDDGASHGTGQEEEDDNDDEEWIDMNAVAE